MDKVLAELHLVYEGVFDEKLLADFFTDGRLFCRHKKDGEIALWPKYLYENATRSTMIRTGVLFLQGLTVKNIITCQIKRFKRKTTQPADLEFSFNSMKAECVRKLFSYLKII